MCVQIHLSLTARNPTPSFPLQCLSQKTRQPGPQHYRMIQSVLQYLHLPTSITSITKQFNKQLGRIFRTYFSPLHFLSSPSFVFTPCYFHFTYRKTGTVTSDFASLSFYFVFSSLPYFPILSSHSTNTLVPPPSLFNYHFSSLFNLLMIRNNTLCPALNCQLPSIQLSNS